MTDYLNAADIVPTGSEQIRKSIDQFQGNVGAALGTMAIDVIGRILALIGCSDFSPSLLTHGPAA